MYSVVVVDDHPAICLAVKATIEMDGEFKVVGEAATGLAALSIVRDRLPSLVVVDLDLPGMNGLSLIGRIRNEHPGVRLLVLSAQQEAIFAIRALKAGADGFVSKTEDMRKVAGAARSVLAGYSVFPMCALALFTDAGADAGSGASQLSSLTDRELTVLQYLARGLSNREISDLLHISNKTVSTFKARIFEKLGISTIVEVVDLARRHHLIM
jgi:DNA-binding NarL/FixJ family response regulator